MPLSVGYPLSPCKKVTSLIVTQFGCRFSCVCAASLQMLRFKDKLATFKTSVGVTVRFGGC